MKLQLRKHVKIAPGVMLNIGKTGFSFTLGPKGFTTTMKPKNTVQNQTLFSLSRPSFIRATIKFFTAYFVGAGLSVLLTFTPLIVKYRSDTPPEWAMASSIFLVAVLGLVAGIWWVHRYWRQFSRH